MKNSFKKTFPLDKKDGKKLTSTSKRNQFSRAEIRFLLKRLLRPNFKIFNRALNKTILFILERKFVSTAWNI